MGLWDRLTSTRRPAEGVAARPAAEVRERILALNRPTAPWRVVDAATVPDADGADLVAEWRIVDARWVEVFAAAGLEKVFRVRLRLDEAEHQVRARDDEYEVAWRAGVPELSLSRSRTTGQVQSVQFGRAWAFTEELRPGEVYRYRFATGELKGPIQEVVASCGWTYRGVAFGRL